MTLDELAAARLDGGVEDFQRIDGDPPGELVFVHHRSCHGWCEYACGGSFYRVANGRVTRSREP